MKYQDARQAITGIIKKMLPHPDYVSSLGAPKLDCFNSNNPRICTRIPIEHYFLRLSQYLIEGSASDDEGHIALLISTLVYIDLFIKACPSIGFTPFSAHRVLGLAVAMSHKAHLDVFFSNKFIARVIGTPLNEFNLLELEFLFRTNFSLHIDKDTYDTYYLELEHWIKHHPQKLDPQKIKEKSYASPKSATVQAVELSVPSKVQNHAPHRPPALPTDMEKRQHQIREQQISDLRPPSGIPSNRIPSTTVEAKKSAPARKKHWPRPRRSTPRDLYRRIQRPVSSGPQYLRFNPANKQVITSSLTGSLSLPAPGCEPCEISVNKPSLLKQYRDRVRHKLLPQLERKHSTKAKASLPSIEGSTNKQKFSQWSPYCG